MQETEMRCALNLLARAKGLPFHGFAHSWSIRLNQGAECVLCQSHFDEYLSFE
jgi:hypothetical protein